MGDFFSYRGECSENGSIWSVRLYQEACAVVFIEKPTVSDALKILPR
jgi:hypothetical protein